MSASPAALPQMTDLGVSFIVKADRRQAYPRRHAARGGGRRLTDQPAAAAATRRSALLEFSAEGRAPRVFGHCRL